MSRESVCVCVKIRGHQDTDDDDEEMLRHRQRNVIITTEKERGDSDDEHHGFLRHVVHTHAKHVLFKKRAVAA